MTCEEASQNLLKLWLSFGRDPWRVLMQKKWGGNREKWFYSEMWENAACEYSMGLSMYEIHMETIEYTWVHIW